MKTRCCFTCPSIQTWLFVWLLLPVSGFAEEVHVSVVNYLGTKGRLWLHCKSKDDDLKEQVIPFKDYYTWSFTPNFWGTTLFWCNFAWYIKPRIKVQAGYVVYEAGRCGKGCHWKAQGDGLYLLGSDWQKIYQWPLPDALAP